jgi:GDP-L-fucose synthase
MDAGKLKSMGWQPRIALAEGLASTYRWFVEHQGEFKAQ